MVFHPQNIFAITMHAVRLKTMPVNYDILMGCSWMGFFCQKKEICICLCVSFLANARL